MICVNDLRQLDLFATASDGILQWVCDHAEECSYDAGATLVEEGDPPKGFFIHLAGEIQILRRSDGHVMPIGKHSAPSFFGEVQIYTDELVPITLKAQTPCTVYVMNRDDFRQLMLSSRDIEIRIFRTIQDRVRRLESFLRNREKMAALGTLAAGLAHELNNPAAALARTMDHLHPKILQLQDMNLSYGKHNVDEEHTRQWLALRDKGFARIMRNDLSNKELAAREDEFLDWLENCEVPEAWEHAAALAASGLTIDEIQAVTEYWRDDPTPLRYQGVQWLGLSFEVLSMIVDGQRASQRIFELVEAVKSYSYMDQDVQQEVDVHQGIEDTLKILRHKLKYGITVSTHYGQDLPRIRAFGSELNQVWTNLLDNAIDAMDGQGNIDIRTHLEGEAVCITITDDGPGIPQDVQSRIFESFFTTKGVGKGSGLGLDITRRIVENRHKGFISFESMPGQTTFTVQLPITA
ncbi:MAG: ATP-binding protein [Candidatus Competibacteraceae bacterium]|jgi:signal transduction histidine kinase|nr:ATP-binding protein [Candidatus Competibacteraceae bacterium]